MNKKMIIITSAGFVIGVAEAIIYYNLGKSKDGEFSYQLPERKELVKTMGIVLATSILTAGLVHGIEKMIPENTPQLATA